MLLKHKGLIYSGVEEFCELGGKAEDEEVRHCAHDIALGKEINGHDEPYPVGHPYRIFWENRIQSAGFCDGREGFERALLMAKEIRFPPPGTLKLKDLSSRPKRK